MQKYKKKPTSEELTEATKKAYKRLAYAIVVDYLKDCERLERKIKRLEINRDKIGLQNPIFYRREQIKVSWAQREFEITKMFESDPVYEVCLEILGHDLKYFKNKWEEMKNGKK